MKELIILKDLNDQQKEAVLSIDGPVFVVAGAGTGKTRTLTTRVVYLIQAGVNPDNILTLTFTNKAANEMKQRISYMLQEAGKEIIDLKLKYMSTFHSFGLRFLKKNIEVLENGLTKEFAVCDEDDAKKLVKEVLKENNYDDKEFPFKDTFEKITGLKVGRYRFYVKTEELESILTKYQQKLIDNNLCDFDDLLLYTKQILEKHPKIRTYYQNQFEYILVDEFQDTDLIQYQILKLLTNQQKNIFVVGDPDQSIYSFRGARYENNNAFIKEYNAKVLVLDDNYRSTNLILEKANRLINHNLDRHPSHKGKNLKSELGQGNAPVFRSFERDIDEAVWVANEISDLYKKAKYQLKDIAVLYRSNYLGRIFEEVFARRGISYIIYGGISFFERREVKDMLAYLRLTISSDYNFYFKRIVNVPKRKIGPVTIEKIEEIAKYYQINNLEAISKLNLSGQTMSNLNDFKEIIFSLQSFADENPKLPEILDQIISLTKYDEYLKLDGEEGLDRLRNVMELKAILYRGDYYYEGSAKTKLLSILDEISLMTDQDKNEMVEDSVILSTYHQVKGLEFKAVFMVAMEEGVFPSKMSMDSIQELEEERRIAYVGITRAKEKLYLLRAKTRYIYGNRQITISSRFFDETKDIKIINQDGLIKIADDLDLSYNLGDKVFHDIFGQGIIVAIEPEIVTIAFKQEFGIKKVIIGHPALHIKPNDSN